ncbi:hypothetical protein ABPG75_011734 [Micractinium tetrahymenae]
MAMRSAELLIALLLIAAAAAAREPLGVEAFSLQPSSVSCVDPAALPAGAGAVAYRPCTFSNLYLWNNTAHFLAADGTEPPDITQLGLRLEVWARRENANAGCVERHNRTLKDTISALILAKPEVPSWVTHLWSVQKSVNNMPHAAHGGTMTAAQATGGSSSSKDGNASTHGGGGGVAKGGVEPHIPRGVAPHVEKSPCDMPGSGRAGRANYGHFSAEWLPPLFMTLCEHFGHCSYEDRERLRLVDVQHKYCNRHENYPPFYTDLLSCLSSAPLRHLSGSALRGAGPAGHGQVTLVKEAWVGLGPRCRGIVDGCYEASSGRAPPTPALLVLLVDRRYESGRHLLNVNSIVRALRSRFSAEHVDVQLAYMEGLSVQQQAALWSNATVVLHQHGAALGSYFFLPRHAVTVQLSALPAGRNQYNPVLYTRRLEANLANVSAISATDWFNTRPSRVHLNTEFVTAMLPRKPSLALFMADRALYGEFAATFRCPPGLSPDQAAACKSLLLNLNLVIDPGEAVSIATKALHLAFEKQGAAVPPALLVQDGGGSSTSSSSEGASGSSDGSEGGSRPAGAAEQRQQRRPQQRSGSAAAQLRVLQRLQAEGGVQLVVLGVLLGSLGMLGLHSIGRLIHWPTLPKRRFAAPL